MNRFLLIGVNHKTAPVEVRERLAIPESRLPEATKRLAGHAGIEEAMIVSTCNRVELLARAPTAPPTCAASSANISRSSPARWSSTSTNTASGRRCGTCSA